MRSFLCVFFIACLPAIALYSADASEPSGNIFSEVVVKINRLKEEQERVKKNPLFELDGCSQIVSGLVTRVKRTKKNFFLITMVVKNVWKGDAKVDQVTFIYEKQPTLSNSSASGNVVRHRTKTLDNNSEGATIMPSAHHRALSFGKNSRSNNIALYSNIIAYLTKDHHEYRVDKEGHDYRLLGFENK